MIFARVRATDTSMIKGFFLQLELLILQLAFPKMSNIITTAYHCKLTIYIAISITHRGAPTISEKYCMKYKHQCCLRNDNG